MVVGVTLFIVAVLVVAIWVLIEMQRFKHKIFAIVLIGFILISYLSFVIILRGHDYNLKTPSGIIDATKVYFSWMLHATKNFGTITTNAVKMDWGIPKNVSTSNSDSDKGIISDLLG